MSERSSRRRLRLRRKRKDQTLGPKLPDVSNRRNVADDYRALGRDVAEEVVFRTGCCLVEAVLSSIALFALVSVPAYLLLTKAT